MTNRLRLNMIYEVSKQMPAKGKTAMMKIMYFLQEVYKVPLKYDFDIYTYGPFDEDVLAFIGFAKSEGLININSEVSSGFMRYEITPNADIETADLPEDYIEAVKEIRQHFSGYSAREWELASTIVFAHRYHNENQNEMNMDRLIDDVRRVKPHFTAEDIEKERKYLEDLEILAKAVT